MLSLASASCVGGDDIANALATVLVQQCKRRAMARAVRPSISCKRRISAQRETFMGTSLDRLEKAEPPGCGGSRRTGPDRRRGAGAWRQARRAPAPTAPGI